MKKFRLPLALFAICIAIASAFAATTPNDAKPVVKAKPVITYYFELSSGGNPMTRTDWVLSADDPSCPTTHTPDPCRIKTSAKSGSNPTTGEFSDILSGSANFSQDYPAKVTYIP